MRDNTHTASCSFVCMCSEERGLQILSVMRTLVQRGERREVFWDVVPLVSTQGIASICVKAGGGKLQHAALADGELGNAVEEPYWLQVVDVVF